MNSTIHPFKKIILFSAACLLLGTIGIAPSYALTGTVTIQFKDINTLNSSYMGTSGSSDGSGSADCGSGRPQWNFTLPSYPAIQTANIKMTFENGEYETKISNYTISSSYVNPQQYSVTSNILGQLPAYVQSSTFSPVLKGFTVDSDASFKEKDVDSKSGDVCTATLTLPAQVSYLPVIPINPKVTGVCPPSQDKIIYQSPNPRSFVFNVSDAGSFAVSSVDGCILSSTVPTTITCTFTYTDPTLGVPGCAI